MKIFFSDNEKTDNSNEYISYFFVQNLLGFNHITPKH